VTRKDYVVLAKALSIPYNSFSKNEYDRRELTGVECAMLAIADALETDNPRFNRDRFFAVVRGERKEA
jgi:hypothetical protein